MKHFDAIVIGSGESAQKMVSALAAEGHAAQWVRPAGLEDAPIESLLRKLSLQDHAESSHADLPAESTPVEFESDRALRVGPDIWAADRFVIATGARFRRPPFQGLIHVNPMTPVDFLAAEKKTSVVIVGHGPLAVALGFWGLSQGRTVALISDAARLLPREEPELAATAAEHFLQRGGSLVLGVSGLQFRRPSGQIQVAFDRDGQRSDICADDVVIATGLTPNTEGLRLDKAEVHLDPRGAIPVTEDTKTSSSRIFAVGPVTPSGRSLSEMNRQIHAAAKNVFAPFFAQHRIPPEPVPFHIPMDPPLARAGLTETEARKKWNDVKCAVMPVPNGMAKLVGRKKSGRILGAHFYCPGASELSLLFHLALQMELTVGDFQEPGHFPPLTASSYAENLIHTWLGA